MSSHVSMFFSQKNFKSSNIHSEDSSDSSDDEKVAKV